jgi:hypothetical protein
MEGKPEAASAVRQVIDEILARPEHQWFESQKATKGVDAAAG